MHSVTISPSNQPAILGGEQAVANEAADMFAWPIVTKEIEAAILDILHRRAMSATDVTKEFEREWAAYNGTRHALACCNGTAALLASLWACGVGAGDEVICPGITYWASAAPVLQLGAAVNFADIDRDTLCIDPADIEHRIGPRTRCIVAVHYAGHPADMDPIMEIAGRHGILVLEDNSHAHGALYKGRMTGKLGHIAAMSMMTGKAFAIGEGGMIVTDDRGLYERCVAFGHYERTGAASNFNPADSQVSDAELAKFAGLPIGGAKHRLNQIASAMGRVQLRHYPGQMKEIQSAMNRFWGLLEGVPGIHPHRPRWPESTMGGWYTAKGLYRSDELEELSCERFCEAVRAEGVTTKPGANFPLHTHPVFHDLDIFHQGQPTMTAFGQRDVRQGPGSLPVSESIGEIAFSIPWFKHDRPAVIEQYANAFRKVAENARSLV